MIESQPIATIPVPTIDSVPSEHREQIMNWYAVYCRAQHEWRIAQQFSGRSMESFFPVYQRLRRHRNRKIVATLPLFPGYVFVRLALDDRRRAVTVPGVVCWVSSGGTPLPIPASEIESLKNCTERKLKMEPCPFLNKGQKVRVAHGPFANLEGILLAKKNHFRLVLSISSINRSVAVELDSADVVPV